MPSLWISLPPPFFPQLYILSITSYCRGYPSGQLGSAVLAASPPSSCTATTFTGGMGWEVQKALAVYKQCAAITKTSLCYQHCLQQKSKTQPLTSPLPAIRKKFNSTIAKISTERTALLTPGVCDLTIYCKGAEKQNSCRYFQGRSSVFGMANTPETEGICPLQKHQLLPWLCSHLWKGRFNLLPIPHHKHFRHGQPPSPHP